MERTQQTDVLVLGGGAAGIAAAAAAARKGLRVVLIEQNSYLGGKATAAEVGTVCGLYKFNKKEIAEYAVKGFARTFSEKLQEISGSCPLHNTDGLHYLPYEIHVFKNIAEQLLRDLGVIVYFNSVLSSVETKNNHVVSVAIIADGNPTTIRMRSVIDCSGNGIISQAAGLPLIKSESYQAAAQVFTMEGVQETNEARLGMILIRSLQSSVNNGLLADFYDRVYIVPGSLKNNRVSFKVGIPLPVTNAPGNLQELETVAHSFVEILTRHLIDQVPVFKNASVHHVAPEVGIRIGQRSTGNYILTREDVLQCKKFTDAVAVGAWPVEEWKQQKRVSMSFLKEGDVYQVPAGCLESPHLINLFFGGRNISATDGAIASARVMGICLQTGYAAGCLASASSLKITRTEAVREIQNEQL